MNVEARPDHRYHMTLVDGPVPAARDFELAWTPDVGAGPGAALFTETKDGKTYALLMALPPPLPKSAAPRPPREVTYIIDTSGSMEGVSIEQARNALLMALDRLQDGDRFNVIEFNSVTHSLFAPWPREAVRRGAARPRRHRDAAGARHRARRLARSVDPAPGRVPHRRRGR
jgi:Ca-activated chloride channel family protein